MYLKRNSKEAQGRPNEADGGCNWILKGIEREAKASSKEATGGFERVVFV